MRTHTPFTHIQAHKHTHISIREEFQAADAREEFSIYLKNAHAHSYINTRSHRTQSHTHIHTTHTRIGTHTRKHTRGVPGQEEFPQGKAHLHTHTHTNSHTTQHTLIHISNYFAFEPVFNCSFIFASTQVIYEVIEIREYDMSWQKAQKLLNSDTMDSTKLADALIKIGLGVKRSLYQTDKVRY